MCACITSILIIGKAEAFEGLAKVSSSIGFSIRTLQFFLLSVTVLLLIRSIQNADERREKHLLGVGVDLFSTMLSILCYRFVSFMLRKEMAIDLSIS